VFFIHPNKLVIIFFPW